MTRRPFYGMCEACHEPVGGGDPRTAAFPVRGWELDRKGKGGANHIHQRERVPDRVRHQGCIPTKQHEQQGRLI